MKIIIAPQAFKGTLSGIEVANAIQKGVLKVFPEATTLLLPVADGGDGTLDILVRSKSGIIYYINVSGPLGGPVLAPYAILPDGHTAIIELACICGLALLPLNERNPLYTSTFGVGEIIRAALDSGCRRFMIGIGGSATNDAGAGLAQALGIRLLDKNGDDLSSGGASLIHLDRIDMSGLDPRIKDSEIIVGCDVINPLIGPNGATVIYGPQKGASDQDITNLEDAIEHFAAIVQRDLGIDIRSMPKGGSAGGTGAGLKAFLGAKLVLGSEMVLDSINFDNSIEGFDLIITGEGCLDQQTAYYKAPCAVAQSAKRHNIPVFAIVGTVKNGYEEVYRFGIDAIFPISWEPFQPGQEPDSFHSSKLIAQATEQALRCFRKFMH